MCMFFVWMVSFKTRGQPQVPSQKCHPPPLQSGFLKGQIGMPVSSWDHPVSCSTTPVIFTLSSEDRTRVLMFVRQTLHQAALMFDSWENISNISGWPLYIATQAITTLNFMPPAPPDAGVTGAHHHTQLTRYWRLNPGLHCILTLTQVFYLFCLISSLHIILIFS